MYDIILGFAQSCLLSLSGATNENIIQNHLNIALFNAF